MQETTALLVLMPGLDGTGLLFERVAAELPSEIRTHIVSYPNDAAQSLEEHAAAASGILANERAVLLAESFSGLVVLKLLEENGVRVEKVIFIASFAEAPRRFLDVLSPLFPVLARGIKFVPSALWRIFCLGPRASDADIGWLKGVLARVNPEVIAHRLKLVASARLVPSGRIEVPAFYIQAIGDRLVPASAARALGALFRDFTVLRVDGPHFLLQAAPKECAETIAKLILEDAPDVAARIGSDVVCKNSRKN